MADENKVYVNQSTTLVQIDTAAMFQNGTTNALMLKRHIVLLSSLNAPGTLVTIRDITGNANNNNITISTTKDIIFYGGTGDLNGGDKNIYKITQPYGFVTVTPKTSGSWGILNSFAFPDAASAANVINLTVRNSHTENANISTAYISTLSTDNLFVQNNISVGQSTIGHAGFYVCTLRSLHDMITSGTLYAGSTMSSIFANITSTLTVPYISTQNIEIYGVLRSASTISTMGPLFVGSSISTTGNLAVGGSTFIQGELQVLQNVRFQSSLSTLYNLGVGREAMFYSSLSVKDDIFTNGSLSTLQNVNVGGGLSVMKTAFFLGQVSTQSNLTVGGALSVMSTFYTYGDAVLNSSLFLRGGMSTLSNVYIASTLSVGKDLAVYGDSFFNKIAINGNLSVGQDLFVHNNISTYSSIVAGQFLRIMGSTFLMGPVSTLSNVDVGGGISTMKDLAVTGIGYFQSNVLIQSSLSTVGNITACGFVSTLSSMNVGHSLQVNRDLLVISSLNVFGSTMLQSSVYITGCLSVFSSLAVSWNVDIGNRLTVKNMNTEILETSTFSVVQQSNFVMNISSSTLHYGLFSTFGGMDIGGKISTPNALVVGSTIDTQYINIRRTLSTIDAGIGSNLFVLRSMQSGESTIVNGGFYGNNEAFFKESVQMKSLAVTENVNVGGDVNVVKDVRITKRTTMGQMVTMTGGLKVSVEGTSFTYPQNIIENDTYMSSLKTSSITVYGFQSTFGQAAFYSSMQIQGGLSVFSSLAIACNADVGALLTASSISVRSLQVSTMSIVQQSNFVLNISSSTLHAGLFSTSGAIFSGAPISTMGSLAVGDNVNFYRNLTVGGNTVTNGVLQAGGATTLSNILQVANVTTLSNTLAVGQATTLSNTLDVGQATTLSNTLAVGQATTLSNTLAVGQATTLSNTLAVGQAATLSNTLKVNLGTTLTGNVGIGIESNATNALFVNGTTRFNGNVGVQADANIYALNVNGTVLTSNLLAISTTLQSNLYVPYIYNSSLQTSSILASSITAVNITTNQLTAISSLTQNAYITNIYNSSLHTSSILASSITAVNITTNQLTGVSSLTQNAYITNIYNSSLQTSSILASTITAIKMNIVQLTTLTYLTQDAYITNIYNSSLQTSSILTSSMRAVNITTNQLTAVSSLTQNAFITNIYNSSLQTSSILTSSINVNGDINFTGVINSNGSPVVFIPPGINSVGNVGLNTFPSPQYNITAGGTSAFVKDSTFFGNMIIPGNLGNATAFVGSGVQGPFTPGIGVNAILDTPTGCAVGQDGTIYVLNNTRICQITNGAATLLATTLTFTSLYLATIGLDGSLYVSDGLTIKKVTNGALTVYTNTNAIGGICIDKDGNIYFSEKNGSVIKRVTSPTTASLFATVGVNLRGLAIDLQGNIYAANIYSIHKITNGVVTDLAGNEGSMPLPTPITQLTLATNPINSGSISNTPNVTSIYQISTDTIATLTAITYTTIGGNQCAIFDNTNYMSLPFRGGTDFTISYWIYVSTDVISKTVWSLSSSATGTTYEINVDLGLENGLIKHTISSEKIGSMTIIFEPLNWTHVTLQFTYSDSLKLCSIYKNGILVANTSITGILNLTHLLLGKAGGTATGSHRGFNGYLRNFNVFNSLVDPEIISGLRKIKISGSSDGQGNIAGFNSINGITCDIQGNVYVADSSNNKIRKVTPAGLVTTIANTGPVMDVKFDSAGNLFYTDTNILYKIPNIPRLITNLTSNKVPGTELTTFAGSGISGSTEGLGTDSTFNGPHSIYHAPDGYIYVSDINTHRIRRIDSLGNVTNFAGTGIADYTDGPRLSATFFQPSGIVMDESGNLYVCSIRKIRKIDSSGNVTTFAGSDSGFADGVGETAQFNDPTGITIAGDSLYVSEYDGNRIRKIVISTQVVSTLAGDTFNTVGISGTTDGTGTAARFDSPEQIVYGPDGFLYVAQKHSIRKISLAGVVTTFVGSTSGYVDGVDAKFNIPSGLAFDSSGNLYVAERLARRIRKITPSGVVTFYTGTFSQVNRISIDSGNLYVADTVANKIYKFAAISYNESSVSIPVLESSTITTSALTTSALTIQNDNILLKTNTFQVPGTKLTNFAGSGTSGSVEGLGTAASFNGPYSIYHAPDGYIYVCENTGHRIRRIDNSGNVTNFAGTGIAGSLEGARLTATFRGPRDMVMDASGNLYVCDSENNRIRKIDKSGTVTTFAGSTSATDGTGTAGFRDGPGIGTAQFFSPISITIVGDNLYVSDLGNNRIRKIDISTQMVTTFAGSIAGTTDGTGISATFNSPQQIVYGPDGFLYVANSNSIRKISLNGVVTTLAGNSISAYVDGVVAKFEDPFGLASDALGNLYVAERLAKRIRKITPSGVVTFYTGTFSQVNRISINSGNLFVADTAGNKIYKFAAITYNDPTVNIPVLASSDLTIKNGNNILLTTNISNNEVSGSELTATIFAGSGVAGSTDGLGTATFNRPYSIYHAPDGYIYVSDLNTHRIRRIDKSGNVTSFAGNGSGGTNGDITVAKFNYPQDMVMDSSGNLYVCDAVNHRIRKIDSTGNVTNFAGATSATSETGTAGFRDGPGIGTAQFNVPTSITIAGDSLYVSDFNNHRIRRIIIATQVVTTFAGSIAGTTDGTGISATFNNPRQIVYGPDGFLYVANQHSIRKITLAGVVTTFVGGVAGDSNGVGTAAQFRTPSGLAFDSGNLYVAEVTANRIRKVTPAGLVTTFLSGVFSSEVNRISFDSGNLFVADSGFNIIYKFVTTTSNDPSVSIPVLASSTITTNTMINSNLFLTESVDTNTDIARQNIPMLVAVGGNDSPRRNIQYSTDDGLTWKNCITGGFKNNGAAVLYNGSIWVAVGNNGSSGNTQWSTDGINWYHATEDATAGVGIALGWNGKMWIGSYNTCIQYSYDGKNWYKMTATIQIAGTLRTKAFAWSESLGLWVAAGQSATAGATLQWSTDGFTWNNANPVGVPVVLTTSSGGFSSTGTSITTGGYGVAWNGSYFIAVGAGNSAANSILKSTDGKTWRNTSGGFTQGLGIAWSPTLKWVASGTTDTTGQFKTSTDGINWTNSASAVWFTNDAASFVSWTGTSFIAGNSVPSKPMVISKDGTNWYSTQNNFLNNCSGIAAGYGSETINSLAIVGNTRFLGNLAVGSSNVESPGSVVIRYAGTGVSGNTNGPRLTATFQNICSVSSDFQGRIYVYEKNDGAVRNIRRIENGLVATLFSTASLDSDWYAMSVSLEGTIYYARSPDNSSCTVIARRTTSNNGVTFTAEDNFITLRNNVTAMIHSFMNENILYFADQYGIFKFDGTSILIAGAVSSSGNINNEKGTSARFGSIRSLCLDSTQTYMYILDTGNSSIRKMSLIAPYSVTTYAGNGVGYIDGFRLDAKFNQPLGMALDSNNNIYVGDNENHRVRFIDIVTGIVYTAAGSSLGSSSGTGEQAQFSYPRGLTVSVDGYIYVGSTVNGLTDNYVDIMTPFYPNIISLNGTVNINTSPDFTYALNVKGDVNIQGNMNNIKANTITLNTDIWNTSGGHNRLFFASDGSTYVGGTSFRYQPSGPDVFIVDIAGNTSMSGNVGIAIGSTPTRTQLDVNGAQCIRGFKSVTQMGLTNGRLLSDTQGAYNTWNVSGGSGETNYINVFPYGRWTWKRITSWSALTGNPTITNNALVDVMSLDSATGLTVPNTYSATNSISILGSGTGQTMTVGLTVGSLQIGTYYNSGAPVISGSSTTGGLIIQSQSGTISMPNNNLVVGLNVTAYSDVRAKENIVTIDSPLDKIMKMRGVYFTRKEGGSRQVGVIAQEVEEVLPEVVLTDTTENKNKSVAYGNIVALLIEGMKAQQSTINSLLELIKN